MKRILILLIIVSNFLTFSTIFATEQAPDILIIGRDTFYLKTFPLENLKVNKKIIIRPFDNDGKLGKISTGCWRGYIATWKIIDSLLFLIKVENYFSKEKLNIVQYLRNNGYNPKIINGLVLADWYTDTLKNYASILYAEYKNYYLCSFDFYGKDNKKIEIVFKNGRLISNNILPIETYKIGDNLSYYYSQNWGFKGVTLHGIIRENNGKMVRLEVLSFTANNEDITEQIKKKTIKDFDNYWINPRYCEKNE